MKRPFFVTMFFDLLTNGNHNNQLNPRSILSAIAKSIQDSSNSNLKLKPNVLPLY